LKQDARNPDAPATRSISIFDPGTENFEYWHSWDELSELLIRSPHTLSAVNAPDVPRSRRAVVDGRPSALSTGFTGPLRAELAQDRRRAAAAHRTLTRCGDPAGALRACANGRLAMHYLGDSAAAATGLTDAMARARCKEAHWEEAYAAYALATVHRHLSAVPPAAALLRQAALIFEGCADPLGYGYARLGLALTVSDGSVDGGLGPSRAARGHLLASADALRSVGALGGLLTALRLLHAPAPSRSAMSSSSAPALPDASPESSPDTALRVLTRREHEVAGLLASGLTNRQIAARMVIAERTVDTHVQRILAKLHCATRVQVAVLVASSRRTPTH
jgi:DNA-binding CsgD family transcriptional regulator